MEETITILVLLNMTNRLVVVLLLVVLTTKTSSSGCSGSSHSVMNDVAFRERLF